MTTSREFRRIVEKNLRKDRKLLERLAKETDMDPLQLALSSRKVASVDPEKIEKTSIQEQAKIVKNPS